MHWKIHKINSDTISYDLGPPVAEVWVDAAHHLGGRLAVYDEGSRKVLTELFENEHIAAQVEPGLKEHFDIKEGDLLHPWDKRTISYIISQLPRLGFTQIEVWDDAPDPELEEETLDREYLNAEGVLLRYGCAPGTVIDYQIHVATEQSTYTNGALARKESSGTDMELKIMVEGTDDEKVTYSAELIDGTSFQGDEKVPLETIGQQFEITMSTRGHVITCNPEFGISFPQLPGERVELDESWEVEMAPSLKLPDENNNLNTVTVPFTYQNTLSEIYEDDAEPNAIIEVEGAGKFDTGGNLMTVEVSGSHQFEIKEGYLMGSAVRSVNEIKNGDTRVQTVVDIEIDCTYYGD